MTTIKCEIPSLDESFEERLRRHEHQLRQECLAHKAAKLEKAKYNPPWEVVFDRKTTTAAVLPDVVCLRVGGKFTKSVWGFTRRERGTEYDALNPTRCKDHRHFEAEVVEPLVEGMKPGDIVHGYADQIMPHHRRGTVKIVKETVFPRIRAAHYGYHYASQGCPPESELNLFG